MSEQSPNVAAAGAASKSQGQDSSPPVAEGVDGGAGAATKTKGLAGGSPEKPVTQQDLIALQQAMNAKVEAANQEALTLREQLAAQQQAREELEMRLETVGMTQAEASRHIEERTRARSQQQFQDEYQRFQQQQAAFNAQQQAFQRKQAAIANAMQQYNVPYDVAAAAAEQGPEALQAAIIQHVTASTAPSSDSGSDGDPNRVDLGAGQDRPGTPTDEQWEKAVRDRNPTAMWNAVVSEARRNSP